MSKGRRSIVLVVCFGMNEAFKVEGLIVSWMSDGGGVGGVTCGLAVQTVSEFGGSCFWEWGSRGVH